MGKRKLSSSEAEFTEADLSASDDQSYASSGSKTRRKITPSRRPTKKRTKHDLDALNDESRRTLPASSHAKSAHAIRAEDVVSIRTSLLQWYAGVHASRNMPWRKQYDPTSGREERAQRAYEVWISEIMLQQTQVATVIPYYNRWIEKYPTIRDLAGASIDEVNSLWKGLGYYSRASRLLAGAQKAVSEYDGRLPDNAKDMQANIPGIGRYSAGAICSIAYGENAPVLDGNVNRLLSRFLALHAPPKAKTTLDILWNAASVMVQDLGSSSTSSSSTSTSTQYPGDVNQALIELGSTVCKVRDPNCEGCPLRPWCSAYAATQITAPTMAVSDIEDLCKICEPLTVTSDVTAYPMRVEKKKAREELDIVNVVEWRSGSDRQFLLVRRPDSGPWFPLVGEKFEIDAQFFLGLLAGLDEFPTSANVAVSMSAARQLKIPHEILPTLLHDTVRLRDMTGKSSGPEPASTSLRITKVQPAGDVVHVFSHIRKTYRVQWVILEGTPVPPQLASATALPKSPSAVKEGSKGRGKSKKVDDKSEVILGSTWVPLDAVATRKIGVGRRRVGAGRITMQTYDITCILSVELRSAVLNLSNCCTSSDIHERHRALSLIFHPDKHHTEDSKSLATEKFLEVQKAYEVLSDPFLRAVYDSLGEPGLAVNWLEETRTESSEEQLQEIFKQIRHDWAQEKADITISPRGRAVCKVDASSLFIPYQGLEEDAWSLRLLNRLEDVQLLSFSLRHDMQKRIAERSIVSVAARISRRGKSGRGNFIGTLRHQYSPRLAFEATSMLLYPYDISLRSEYQNGPNALSLQTTLTPGGLAFPPIFISVSRKLFRRPDSAQGHLKIDLGRHPQVTVSVVSQNPLDLPLKELHDSSLSVLSRGTINWSWSQGIVLNSFEPKIFGECGLTFKELALQCKLGLEGGLYGLVWLLSGSWASENASLAATIRLGNGGVVLTIDAAYFQQTLSVPILLSEQHNSSLALWTTAVPSLLFLSIYHLGSRNHRQRRLRAISSALRALEPDSPSRKDAEAVISLLKDKAKDCLKAEVAKSGLVILEATYGAMETVDRDQGLFWDVTIPLQTLVLRGSQLCIPGRHPKASIQGILDPAPFAHKSLRVRYLFRGRMHFTEVPEYLSLILPLPDHVVN
ncbi:hypothetical protein DFH09DRAFT_1026727 [Mycena vulgaris]|nr:hypothetical protein DFH09DRAFT_1026727 [Mycena vulgaris]